MSYTPPTPGAPGGYGGYGGVQEHPQGTMILVFGIVGIFFTPLAIAAWVMGSKALKEIDASGVQYSNRSNVSTGKIIGMIVTILAIIGLVIGIIAFIASMAALGSASY
ncbi:DUF4190 domain-containing protein [Ruania alkalisoli]|uniref:DUF4190 domain-containing protein n=1 Tax=Ruania alkalisoli TaxID=2779775 RepID=A0A7M1SRM2_9MICO|nr:DUF4190 domain-containing protein [Ruania alkalisoli]QOR69243.1 DUF4190 domain-containing protein [Ruania alkalisoli]